MDLFDVNLIGDEIRFTMNGIHAYPSTGDLMSLQRQIKDTMREQYAQRCEWAIRQDPILLVAAGMAWLDTYYPNHVDNFNPGDFHIMCNSGKRCALMMASGLGWTEALERHPELDYGGANLRGFVTAWSHGEEPAAEYDGRIERLNQAWLKAYATLKNS